MGEIAAIVIIVIIVATVVVIVVAGALYYYQKRKRKYELARSPNDYIAYVTDTDAFNKATGGAEPAEEGERESLLGSHTIQMQSKKNTLPVQAVIATNKSAVNEFMTEEDAANETTNMLKSGGDTHL